MQLPSSTHRDVVPDHIDPIPFPETLQEAQLLCRLMDVNIRLAVPRDSIEDSGELGATIVLRRLVSAFAPNELLGQYGRGYSVRGAPASSHSFSDPPPVIRRWYSFGPKSILDCPCFTSRS